LCGRRKFQGAGLSAHGMAVFVFVFFALSAIPIPDDTRELEFVILHGIFYFHGNLTTCGSTLWVRVKRHAIHHDCIFLCTEDTWKGYYKSSSRHVYVEDALCSTLMVFPPKSSAFYGVLWSSHFLPFFRILWLKMGQHGPT